MNQFYNPYPNYQGYQQTQQYNPYQMQYQPQIQQPQLVQPTLNGKIVDGIDTVKIQDVPMGSFGVYPKADMSGVYVKVWQNDGSTRIIEYSPIVTENKPVEKVFNYEEAFNSLKESIANLDSKIDKIQSMKQPRKRVDEYDE